MREKTSTFSLRGWRSWEKLRTWRGFRGDKVGLDRKISPFPPDRAKRGGVESH
ncbi:hypothetical protein ES703_35502 [subsurface metagenome]